MKRTATASWLGDLQEGKGTLTTQSQALKETPYSFKTRFDNVKGTNPEELIGAAHAGCFTMALAGALTQNGFKPRRLDTQAVVNFEQEQGKWTINTVNLSLKAHVQGIDHEQFEKIANEAKENCPISRVLKAQISLDIELETL